MVHRRNHLRGLYHIQSLPGSRPRRGFFLMFAVKSHCWLCPSTKRVGATSLSGSPLSVLALNILPGFDAPCHAVTTFTPSAQCTADLQALKAAWAQGRLTTRAQWIQLQTLAQAVRADCGWAADRR